MAEKPPEEGYISVVDEEPELLQLLKWDPPQMVKHHEPEVAPVEKQKTTKRSKAQDCDPFDLQEPDFIETFRLSKDLVRHLCEELKPVLPESTKAGEFPAETRVLTALAFYASGKYMKVVGKSDPNVTQYFITSAVVQFTEAMNHPNIVKKYIHFPHLKEERDVLKAKFYMKYGIPNVVGCVDCTHVPICKPDDDSKSHYNKSYHSKKVQIICDSDLNIIGVNPSPGGLTHDTIIRKHALRVDLETLNNSGEPCWLVASPYYSVAPYIMTPIPKITKKSPASPEKYYNTMHSQAHQTVIDTIKHWKCRWKCLQTACNKQFDPAMVSMMVVTCCILHNLCNKRGLPTSSMTPAEERVESMKQRVANGQLSKKLNEDENGVRVRQQLTERLWSERRQTPEAAPKKRAKKDNNRLIENPVQNQQMHHNHHSHNQMSNQMAQYMTIPDDPNKRARLMGPAPPTYSLMPQVQVWGHYPPHH